MSEETDITSTNRSVLIRTINLMTEVLPDREVRITLPSDVPLGPAEIVVVVASRAGATAPSLGNLLHSEFFGMWRDRTDIDDSVEFARRLRTEAWSRSS
ncbi:MAG: hypothetical protein GWN13_09925 [Phycisphaerae bacterium]|nr:hypothetical protein [Phycisphaerae bacterium]